MLRSIGKFVSLLFYFAIAVLVILLSVANRDNLVLSFFPLPYEVEMPKFLLILVIFALGLLSGMMSLWFSNRTQRRQSRENTRRVAALENQISAMRVENSAKHIID